MRPWHFIAFWATLLALWTLLQLLFSPPAVTLALLGGAAVAVAGLALLATRERPVRNAPDLSPATPLLALGAGLLVSGFELGTWCILLGALIAACGLAALRSEVRR
jgi:energy-converting hydrogenase Eha subunit A